VSKNNAILEVYVCYTVFLRVNNKRMKYLMANKIRTSKTVATKASSQPATSNKVCGRKCFKE